MHGRRARFKLRPIPRPRPLSRPAPALARSRGERNDLDDQVARPPREHWRELRLIQSDADHSRPDPKDLRAWRRAFGQLRPRGTRASQNRRDAARALASTEAARTCGRRPTTRFFHYKQGYAIPHLVAARIRPHGSARLARPRRAGADRALLRRGQSCRVQRAGALTSNVATRCALATNVALARLRRADIRRRRLPDKSIRYQRARGRHPSPCAALARWTCVAPRTNLPPSPTPHD